MLEILLKMVDVEIRLLWDKIASLKNTIRSYHDIREYHAISADIENKTNEINLIESHLDGLYTLKDELKAHNSTYILRYWLNNPEWRKFDKYYSKVFWEIMEKAYYAK